MFLIKSSFIFICVFAHRLLHKLKVRTIYFIYLWYEFRLIQNSWWIEMNMFNVG